MSTQTISSHIPDIEQKWKEYKKRRIKSYPQNTLRASSIGHPCDRYLYHSIKDWKERALHDAVLQSIFDEGALHEEDAIKQLKEMGFVVVEQQRSFQLDEPLITGHIDGILLWEEKTYPFDIKSIGPNDFNKISSVEDLTNSHKVHQRQYPAQLQIYLLLTQSEYGCFILKNKLTGELKAIWMQIDYDYCDQILKKASRVYQALKESSPPQRTKDIRNCEDCAFKHVCLPDLQYEGTPLIDNEELLKLLSKRYELLEHSKQFDQIDGEVKKFFSQTGVGEKICGDFLVKTTSVKVKRKIPITYEEKEDSYLKTQIVKIKS